MPLRLHLLPKSPPFTGVRPLKMEFLGFNLDASPLICQCTLCHVEEGFPVDFIHWAICKHFSLHVKQRKSSENHSSGAPHSIRFLLFKLVKSYSLFLKGLVKVVSTKLKVTAIIHLFSLKQLNCNISK